MCRRSACAEALERVDMDGPRAADAQIEERIGLILKAGVAVSTACLAGGLLLGLALGDTTLVRLVLNIGLVLLLATPVARVAASVIEYARARDWRFVVLTAVVLAELIAGVMAALVFHRRL
jgi:uncharacterized membrane protein